MHLGQDPPENTLAAFAAALEMGAGIECDIRLTADDQIIVFHDADARRLCASPLTVGHSTLKQISELRVADHAIPTLQSLLELVSGKVPLLLEIKVDGRLSPWKRALAIALEPYRGALGVMSFDPRIAWLLKTHLPAVRRGLVFRRDASPLRRGLATMFGNPQFVAIEQYALGSSWSRRARQRVPIYGWTIETAAERAKAQVHADALIWENDGRPRI